MIDWTDSRTLANLLRGIADVIESLEPGDFSDEEAAAQTNAEELTVPEILRMAKGLGSRQKQIVCLPGLNTDEGIRTKEIATQLQWADVPNAYLTLQRLRTLELVELIPDSHPQRWHLAAHYRF